ncbi:MAG: carboxypeptidase regulatory-like domain-containing protein [Planctomycetes bacterium]|nr:carboxypeptidase regulatory-like domain-containing protein [Planctomycetota bacterium]
MNRLLLALLCLVLVGAAGLTVWLTFGSEGGGGAASPAPRLELGAAGEERAGESAALDAPESTSARSESAAVLEPDPVTGEVLDDVPQGVAPSTYVPRAYLHGRIVDRAGKPITGMDLRLVGKVANLRRKEAWPGDASVWKHIDRRTDAQGSFAFAFRPLPPLEFMLETRDQRFLTFRKRWKEFEPGKREDLGEIVLSRGGSVKGRLTDQSGDPIAGGWEIELQPLEGTDAERLRRDPDPKPLGSFLVQNVAQGKWTPSIRFRRGLPEGGSVLASPEGPLEVKEGEQKEVNFTYAGPPLRTSITLDIRGAKTGERPLAEHVRLVGGNAGVQIAGEAGKPVSSYTWNDLSFTTYTLEINDPRFLPWRKEGVKPSPAPIEAKVQGNSKIKVKAVRARDAQPVSFYGVKIKPLAKPIEGEGQEAEMRRRMEGLGLENLIALSRDKEQPGGVCELDGLVAGDWVLVVDSKLYTRGEVEVRGLVAGETREVEVLLSQGTYIAGTVVGSDGKTPIASASVMIEPYGEATEGEDPMARMASRFRSLKKDSRHATTSTDERGHFAFDNLEPGTYTVRAKYELKLDNMLGMMDFFNSGGAGLVVVKEGINAGNKERIEDLVLALPAGAFFRGKLLAPEKADFKDVNLRLRSAGSEEFSSEMSVSFRVDEEGRFEVGPLRPGPATLTVLLFDEEDMTSFGRIQQRELGEYVLSAGDSGEREIDVRDIWPGKVRVRVLRDQKPIEGARVTLQAVGGERRGFQRFSGERTNKEGVVDYAQVFAGALEVSVSKDSWTIRHPSTVYLSPGGTADVDLNVVLYEGTLTVVDKQGGSALSERSFFLREPGGGMADRPLRTDAQGQIKLELAPGSYELVPIDEDGFRRRRRPGGGDFQRILDSTGVRVEWGSSGPNPATVAFQTGSAEPEAKEKTEPPKDGEAPKNEGGGGL